MNYKTFLSGGKKIFSVLFKKIKIQRELFYNTIFRQNQFFSMINMKNYMFSVENFKFKQNNEIFMFSFSRRGTTFKIFWVYLCYLFVREILN